MAGHNTGARTAPASPSVAVPIGTDVRGKIVGVTRIGSRAGLIAIGIVAAVVLAIVYGISTTGKGHAEATPVAAVPQALPTDGPAFENIPGADPNSPNAQPSIDPRYDPNYQSRPAARPVRQTAVRQAAPRPRQAQTVAAAPVLPDPATQSALTRTSEVPDVRAVPQTEQRMTLPETQVASSADVARAVALERQRQQAQIADAARHAAIIISTPANGASAVATAARNAPVAMASPAVASVADASPDPNADPAVASQRAKNDFIKLQKSTTADDYSLSERQAAISPYEVQAGSIIPGILITGINSDLPGQMVGQVSQDVYDSKTGTYLLIPSGSKLVGRYDSQVVNGQSRVLVAWQRIIFPDSSFIDIHGLTGSDTAGYSGFTGKVDDHSGKLFRNAILFSLIGAGAALLQPRTAIAAVTGGATVVAAPSVGSQIAGQVGGQISQTAQQVTGRGMQQQPTIEVRPGYLFNIMVDHDLVLPGPYTK
jgi:type IV secretory pathway VirB10-like protein